MMWALLLGPQEIFWIEPLEIGMLLVHASIVCLLH